MFSFYVVNRQTGFGSKNLSFYHWLIYNVNHGKHFDAQARGSRSQIPTALWEMQRANILDQSFNPITYTSHIKNNII
jgi:hypothetical protein